MNLLNYIKDIRQRGKRSFTLKQVMSDLNMSKNAALSAIHRLKTHGDLISPSRGLYVIVPTEYQLQGAIPADELVPILMNHLQADYYVSLLSGAQYHGASHQKPIRFQVITNKRIKHPLEFGLVKIELVYKKTLSNLPIQNIVVGVGYLKIATPELVAFDLLTYSNRCGGLNHISTVLSELTESLDADKLISLATVVRKNAWLQRLGFILEQIDPMDREKTNQIIDRLQHYLEGKMLGFVPLAPELSKAGCPRVKKWRIIANTGIESDL